MNIDKQALLEWLNEQANNFAGFGHEGTEAIRYIRWRIESGDFDTPSSDRLRLTAPTQGARV